MQQGSGGNNQYSANESGFLLAPLTAVAICALTSPGCDPGPTGPARQRVPFGLRLLLMVGPSSATEVAEGEDDDRDTVFTRPKLL